MSLSKKIKDILNPKKRVFLDYASTTPISPEIISEMKSVEVFGIYNPSALYTESLKSKELLSSARRKIAEHLGSGKDDIVFTSGGTESNNLALLGVFETYKRDGFVPHFISSVVEHPAVLEVLREIENRGGEVTLLPVGDDGVVSSKDLRDAIKSTTVLVSIMYANNEIGTIQPISEFSKVIRDFRKKNDTRLPYFHTDACQAVCYLDINVLRLGVDMMTVDGIKMYGPRGSGFLYVRNDVLLKPIFFGGGQEKGLRSGTENVISICGLAKALEVSVSTRDKEGERLCVLRDYAIDQILRNFPDSHLNGSKKQRLPNNVNICFPGLDAEFAVISLDVLGVSASYSSSCRTLKEDSSSYVISSLGKKGCDLSSLRFTFGRNTKKADIDFLVSVLKKVVK